MRTIRHMLQATQRTQQLRARAQRLWWHAQIARLAGDEQHYRHLMHDHEQLLAQLHQALSDLAHGRKD